MTKIYKTWAYIRCWPIFFHKLFRKN